ncbi:MAG: GAF domain-containing protein [Dehalococcoidia bacterium]
MPRERILVVDSEQGLIQAVRRSLAEKDLDIETASGAREAIELGSKERFDLLVARVRGVGLDGAEVVATIRRADPTLAAVLVGDGPIMDDAARSLPSGTQSFVTEPFTGGELMRAVEETLGRRRLQRENKRLKAALPLFEISKTLMSEVDLSRLFDLIGKIVWEETEADRVSLMLLDEATQELTIKAALGLPPEVVNKAKVKVGRGIAGWVAKTAEPLMLPEQAETMPHLKAAMVQEEVSSALCMPLIAKGRVIGVLNSSKRMRGAPFTSSDLELLSILCGQAAIAIENAKLFESAKMQQARAERLLTQTIVAQEDERKRISLEIHDGVAQSMVGASFHVRACHRILPESIGPEVWAELAATERVIDQSINELRRVIFDLQPPDLEELGLVDALKHYAQRFERDIGIACHFQAGDIPASVPRSIGIAAYRVAQEALTNIRKHACASQVAIKLSCQAGDLRLEIQDDGKGFNLARVLDDARAAEHAGLLGMRDRAEALAGRLQVETSEGAGTRVSLKLPVMQAVPGENRQPYEMLSEA